MFSSNPLSNIKEALARLVNSLIHALNEPPKETKEQDQVNKNSLTAPFLPRFVIVVPDWDIVKHVGHYKYGFTVITKKLIHWVVANMTRSVDVCRKTYVELKKGLKLHWNLSLFGLTWSTGWIAMTEPYLSITSSIPCLKTHCVNSTITTLWILTER